MTSCPQDSDDDVLVTVYHNAWRHVHKTVIFTSNAVTTANIMNSVFLRKRANLRQRYVKTKLNFNNFLRVSQTKCWYSLTLYSSVLEKLTVEQLFMKFTYFHVTRRPHYKPHPTYSPLIYSWIPLKFSSSNSELNFQVHLSSPSLPWALHPFIT
jgi:hypothetical protein